MKYDGMRPIAESVEERDALIREHLQNALDYMDNDVDNSGGPVADMYARRIVEIFENAEDPAWR